MLNVLFFTFSDNLVVIYQFLGENPDAELSEEKTLLLYHLIHCNSSFKSFLLARTDIEVVVGNSNFYLYFIESNSKFQIFF